MGWRSGWAALAVTSIARALVTLVVCLALVTLVPSALGWTPAVVMSGSMEPVLHIGDVVICRPVTTAELRMGQVVLVDDPDHLGRLRLHRLVGATSDGRLVLRGDHNAHDDSSSVRIAALHGVASLRVPLIGDVFVWAREGDSAALAVAALVAALLLAGCFLFRADEEREGRGPPPRPRRDPDRRRPRGRAAAGAVATIAIVVAGATPADAAPFSATTSSTGNSFASSARFRCSDRFSADSPIDSWKLSETAGPTAADQTSARPGTYSSSGVTYGDAGPCPADGDSAVTLSGASGVGVTTSTPIDPTTIPSFTEEIAFRTTSTAGGLLMGLWSSATSSTGNKDRVLAMSTSGQVYFGMYDTATNHGVKAVSTASYNDGAWHLAAAVYAPGSGLTLYVDGTAVSTAPPITPYTRASLYWRIGFGAVDFADWTPSGSSTPADAFAGSLADAEVYATALSSTQVTNHAQAFAGAQNYAEGRAASQSSTAIGAGAALAVDGNTDGVFADGSVTHTNMDANSWWQVDLRYTLSVSQLQIWNRTDCCGARLADYWVFVSSAPFDVSLSPTQQAAVAGVWSSHQTNAPSPSASIAPPAGTRGRYVMVQEGAANQYLSLAEVRVYGSAPASP